MQTSVQQTSDRSGHAKKDFLTYGVTITKKITVSVVAIGQQLRSVQNVQVVQSLRSVQDVTRLRLTFVQGFKVQAFNDRLGRELPGFRNSGNEGMDAGYRFP
jgi:hypothetical protein